MNDDAFAGFGRHSAAPDDAGHAETRHLLNSPRNADRLRRAIARADAGASVEHEPFEPIETDQNH